MNQVIEAAVKPGGVLTSEAAVFSIIIPTWNNLEYLKLCLRSLDRHSVFNHQRIIHVNEGSDGTRDWLQSHFDGDVSFSPENIGVCKALNAARQLVKTDYILYMNDDMYVCPGWDRPLVDAVKAAPSNLFFFSASMMQQGPFRDKSVIANCNYGRNLETFKEQQLLENWEGHPHYEWSGATWPPNVVHVDLWDQVGGYSEEFSPGMYSDPDFSMKLWRAGVRDFRGLNESRVYHFSKVSTGRVKKNDGAMQFLLKWGMTSATFGRHFLRRGKVYSGPLAGPEFSAAYFFDLLRSKIKLGLYRVFKSG